MLLRIVGSEDDDDNDESILVSGDDEDAGCYWGLAWVKMMVMVAMMRTPGVIEDCWW